MTTPGWFRTISCQRRWEGDFQSYQNHKQSQHHKSVTCANAPDWVQKGPPHVLCSAVAVLKFLIISKQGPLHFQFIQGTASLVADPDHIEWMVREEKGEQEAIFLPKQGQRILESPKLWTLCTSTLSNAAICSTPHEIDYEFLEGRYNTLFSPVYSLKWCLAFSFN